jgi:hypothetical protein
MSWIVDLVLLLLAPFTSSWHALQDRFRGMGKSDWQRVKGSVESCRLKRMEHTWKATVTYSYCAEGDYWSGETSRLFVRERDADAYATAHPSTSVVMVRTCPGKPNKSVVLAEDQLLVSQAGSV